MISRFKACSGSQHNVNKLYDDLVTRVFNEMDAYLDCRNTNIINRKSKHTKPYWTTRLTDLWQKNVYIRERVFEMSP